MMRAVLWRSLASGAWRLMPIRRLVAVNPSVSKCNSPYIYLSFAVCVGRARVDSVLCYLHTSGLDVGAPVVRASTCESVSPTLMAARSMTTKRLSLILIMGCSRNVIEKKKRYSLCQLRDRARANDAPAARRPHAPTRPPPRRSRK